MQEVIIDIVDRYGYMGVMFLIFMENVFPPIPSEVVLAFGGYMTHSTRMQPFFVIMAATVGSLAGAIVLYMCGYLWKKDGVKRLFNCRVGRILRLNKVDVDAADDLMSRYNSKAVFFCRFVPIIRSIISIPAGISEMKLVPFILYTFAGSLIWNMVLVYIGVYSKDAWEQSVQRFGMYGKIAVCVLVIVALTIGFVLYKRKKKRI